MMICCNMYFHNIASSKWSMANIFLKWEQSLLVLCSLSMQCVPHILKLVVKKVIVIIGKDGKYGCQSFSDVLEYSQSVFHPCPKVLC